MIEEPDNVEQVANAVERFCLNSSTDLSDPDFDALSLAASMLRMASAAAPSFMAEIKKRAIALRRQAELFAANSKVTRGA